MSKELTGGPPNREGPVSLLEAHAVAAVRTDPMGERERALRGLRLTVPCGGSEGGALPLVAWELS